MALDVAQRVVAAVVDDAGLRQQLTSAPDDASRREILEDAGLLEGMTDADYAELRRLNSDPVALNDQLLTRVTGGDTATVVGGAGAGQTNLAPSNPSGAGAATIAGDVVVDASSAVLSTGMAIGGAIAIGGSVFGF